MNIKILFLLPAFLSCGKKVPQNMLLPMDQATLAEKDRSELIILKSHT